METQKRGRGRPKIKSNIKELIYIEAVEQKDMPRLALAVKLRSFIEEKMCEIPPSEEYTIKLISDARNHPKSPLDLHWTIGCLGKYDIPPEALPIVRVIYEQRLEERHHRFTIREALWISRLHKIIDDPIVLGHFAYAYALREWVNWILDNPTYTRDLDMTLERYLEGKITASDIKESPCRIHALPTWGYEEEEELEKKLRSKGYSLGISLTEEEAQSKFEKLREGVQNERQHKTKKQK